MSEGASRMDERLGSMTVETALGAIAARTPSPGGGAAVALGAAVGAALGEMVAAYAAARKTNEAHRASIESSGRALLGAREELLALADEDAKAYQALSEAMEKQKRGAADAQAVGIAARAAAAAPSAIIEACEDIVGALEGLVPYAGSLRSDLVAAAALTAASARGAVGHVKANAPLMDQAGLGGAAVVARAAALSAGVAHRCEALMRTPE